MVTKVTMASSSRCDDQENDRMFLYHLSFDLLYIWRLVWQLTTKAMINSTWTAPSVAVLEKNGE